METCVRGFSFMSDSKIDLADLQYIEGGELERAWRSTRRERMKQREQRIWDNFVKEQDIVKGVCNDDPYQFLDQLPESCLKEIMENELQKMTLESAEEARTKEVAQHGNGDNSSGDDGQHTCVVTFADDVDKEDCEMFHIFDDEPSGGEEEAPNEQVASPPTVRAKSPSITQSPERLSLEKTSSKSSENVTNVIESSIYCAKVRDLRMKINEEITALMTTLDRREILSAEPEDIARMIKRSAEFCTRFNRIYMYQLQRQIHDIKRNNSVSLPFAKHTQFQSQMVRIVSLHQNLLQSFQVFHKSVSSTCCVRESAVGLGALLAAVRDTTHMCRNVPPPKDFAAAVDLYNDEVLPTCDKMDEFVNEYAIRCEEILNSYENMNLTYPKKSAKNKGKKRSFGAVWSRNNAKHNERTDAKLSMYSLDTLRLNLNSKSSSSKDNHTGGSSKRGNSGTGANLKRGGIEKNSDGTKTQRKISVPNRLVTLVANAAAERNAMGSIPRSRRPLMRDPHAGRPRAPKPTRETDIRTMVEGVETCASSHVIISRDTSPHSGAVRRSKASTPRRPHHAPHATPRAHAPHLQHAPHTPHTPHVSHVSHLPPVMHIPNVTHDTQRRNQSSPLPTKRSEEPSPTKQKSHPRSPKSSIITKECLSSTRTDLETADMSQMTPVCKIQCAMKKDLEVDDVAKFVDTKSEGSKKSMSPVRNREDSNEKKRNASDNAHLKPVHKVHCSKKDAEDAAKYGECSKGETSPRKSTSPGVSREPASEKRERERIKMANMAPDRCEVTRLIKQLCSGDTAGTDRITGAKNAQLLFVSGSSPRQPSTPQLLRILEETIQKKVPKPLFQKPHSARGPERHRLLFNISEKTADSLFQYRTKFVQHMLTSAMYANSAVGKPWEMIGSVSEQIIDELLLGCLKEMELRDLVFELYKTETR